MAQQTRLKDIAETAGCSIAVVSCVVNGSRGNISCNPELRERILRIAAELHYTPHFASKALRSNRTNTLGVCLRQGDFSSAGFSGILAGIWDACRERKYDTLCLGADEQGCALSLAERRVDALVLPAVPNREGWAVPFVRGDCCCVAATSVGEAPIDSVAADERAAGELAVRVLAERGHRRIGCLDSAPGTGESPSRLRRLGFESAMGERNLEPAADWAFCAEASVALDPVAEAAERFAQAPVTERPTAFVVQTMPLAHRFLRELARRSVDCPKDVSLVCIDAEDEVPTFLPCLSTVGIPYREIGAAAARRAIDRFEALLDCGDGFRVSPGPLPTARLQAGRRGRRPTAVVNALAEESGIRVQNMPRAEGPRVERFRKTVPPTFVDRGSISTLSE